MKVKDEVEMSICCLDVEFSLISDMLRTVYKRFPEKAKREVFELYELANSHVNRLEILEKEALIEEETK